MVNPLKFVEALVKERFAGGAGPEDVPLVRIGIPKTIGFEDASDEFGVTVEQLIHHLKVVDVVTALLLLGGRYII
jgi:hypothetical protein